ncbi:HlyD family efflux transporter periplasmic adaptor subunit [Deltaproteobacteria bacterium TL4]
MNNASPLSPSDEISDSDDLPEEKGLLSLAKPLGSKPSLSKNKTEGGWLSGLWENRNRRLEMQFLPASLELEESPPSPLGRFTLWTVVLLTVITVVWSTLGQVDEVASAQGKVIPSGRVQIVQPFESGVIRSIKVAEGEVIKKGQILIELDPTSGEVNLEGMLHEKYLLLLESARLNAEKNNTTFQVLSSEWFPHITQEDLELQLKMMKSREAQLDLEGLLKERHALMLKIARLDSEKKEMPFVLPSQDWTQSVAKTDLDLEVRLMQARITEHQTRLMKAELNVQQRQSAVTSTESTQKRLKHSVAYTIQEMESLEPLVKMEAIPRERLAKLERQLAMEQQELLGQLSTVRQAQESLSEAKEALNSVQAERQRTILTEWTESERQLSNINSRLDSVRFERDRAILKELNETSHQLSQIESELAKLKQRQQYITLVAPTDGVVLKLGTYTLGGVVQPADPLVYIVPKDAEMVIEAWLPNKDIGFVRKDMEVALKVETFPFQKYGTLPAVLRQVSADSTEHPQFGQVYQLIVGRPEAKNAQQDPWHFSVQNEDRFLSTGMNVTAEIKTGKRRVIMFFLSPLIKTLDESLSIR